MDIVRDIVINEIILYFRRYDGDILYVFPKLLLSSTFWLLTLVIIVVSLIPGYLIRIYESYRPNKILRKNEETPDSMYFVDSDNERVTFDRLQVIIYINVIYI